MWKLLACLANITSSTKTVRWPESSLHKNKIILCVCVCVSSSLLSEIGTDIWNGWQENGCTRYTFYAQRHKAQVLKVCARLLEDFALRLALRPHVDYDLKSTILSNRECWWHNLKKCAFRVIRLSENSILLDGVNKFITSFPYVFTDLGEIVYRSSYIERCAAISSYVNICAGRTVLSIWALMKLCLRA
jgi:hypothetical protein